eukprot:SAG31_NODE_1592_length_7813_cov_28.409386_5_plen_63_part_00
MSTVETATYRYILEFVVLVLLRLRLDQKVSSRLHYSHSTASKQHRRDSYNFGNPGIPHLVQP